MWFAYTRPMSYDEFKECLQPTGLSVRELAALLQMKPNSITNYRSRGLVPRHLEVIATLLATLAAQHIDARQLLKHTPDKQK